jgi:hypothetical protein
MATSGEFGMLRHKGSGQTSFGDYRAAVKKVSI